MSQKQDIINGISSEIYQTMQMLSTELHYPSNSADEMDDKIKEFQNRIKALRLVRDHLEEIFTGAFL